MEDKLVWEWLCQRWASGAFKDDVTPNLVAFYKEKHWSRQKEKFINAIVEHNYNLVVEKLNEKDPDEEIEEVATSIFKDILGYKFGYAKGLAHSVIPNRFPSMQKNKAFVCLVKENEWNKTCAEMYKSKLDQIMGQMAAMRRNFSEYEK
ncbi:uncharacterized protein LOC122315171 [Carya illinoinensis]|uniref:uncharacterized protein LOC122315171 n=1 Tax=Carya illinoinensis TaxID=32201 RepID=UPI001C719992|nr:uncharacterized protein LOC122315171 [Carya illinoinensis]